LIKAIPQFLARDSRQFFSDKDKNQNIPDNISRAIDFMIDAGFGYSVNNVYPIALPFSSNCNLNDFKFYPFDSGILNAIQDQNAFLSLFNNNPDYDCKGDSYETAFLAILRSRNQNAYYSHLDVKNTKFHNHQINDPYEIDFLLDTIDGKFIALEVKAGNEKAKSIEKLSDVTNYKTGYKFGKCNCGYDRAKELLTLPIYAIQFIDL
jgi:predicted AAA+ superfamily ATPase